MPLYEVLLIRDDEEEIRLTDQGFAVGEIVSIGEERWFVEREAALERGDAAGRYVCVPANATG